MSDKIQDLLEELSYAFSTPEAADFNYLMINRKFAKATKMLVEYISHEDADLLVKHLHAENIKTVSLVEISVSEIDLKNDQQRYLIKVGLEFGTSSLIQMSESLGFFLGSSLITLDKVSQIWKIV